MGQQRYTGNKMALEDDSPGGTQSLHTYLDLNADGGVQQKTRLIVFAELVLGNTAYGRALRSVLSLVTLEVNTGSSLNVRVCVCVCARAQDKDKRIQRVEKGYIVGKRSRQWKRRK